MEPQEHLLHRYFDRTIKKHVLIHPRGSFSETKSDQLSTGAKVDTISRHLFTRTIIKNH